MTTDIHDADAGQSPETRRRNLLTRLNDQLDALRSNGGYWAGKLPEGPLASLDDLAGLPILRKSDLPEIQATNAPLGGLNGQPISQLRRLFLSPGPIFDPEGRGPDWWNSARALYAAGARQGDVLLNTFSYHLTPAAFIFEGGAEALGCPVIPAGPGNTADQLTAIRQFRPRVYVGVPDFLKIILDKADEAGVDRSCLKIGMVTGAALPESLRTELSGRGVAVRQCYGTADLGIVAYEADGAGMVVNENIILEIVRPGTGDPVPAGEVGEIVVTRLDASYPLLRFATGDMSAIMTGAQDGPYTNDRIKGWMGRADQATKIKGMFVRAEQIAAIARAVPGITRLRLEVTRQNEQDRMELLAEHTDDALIAPLAASLAEITRLRGEVRLVAPDSLPNDGKVIADLR